MIAHGARAAHRIDPRGDPVADIEYTGFQFAVVAKDIGLDFQRISDIKRTVTTDQFAGVSRLTAGFGVKRRAIEHDHRGFAGLHRLYGAAVAINCDNLRLIHCQRVVTLELGLHALIIDGTAHLELRCGTGTFALLLH